MRGKKCKALRRKAEELTRGMPLVDYEPKKASSLWFGKNAGFIGQSILNQHCTRAVYQQLKRVSE